MAQANHHDGTRTGPASQATFAAELLKRLIWLGAAFYVLAITAGPLFGPAYAGVSEGQREILIWRESDAPTVTLEHGYAALRCRSETDGRQTDLLELAGTRLGGAPISHVATRFWNEQSGTAEVTFEFWHGQDSGHRRLYLGHGTVDMDSCDVELLSLS